MFGSNYSINSKLKMSLFHYFRGVRISNQRFCRFVVFFLHTITKKIIKFAFYKRIKCEEWTLKPKKFYGWKSRLRGCSDRMWEFQHEILPTNSIVRVLTRCLENPIMRGCFQRKYALFLSIIVRLFWDTLKCWFIWFWVNLCN